MNWNLGWFAGAMLGIFSSSVFWSTGQAFGQENKQEPLEYIESSSPLPGGGSVTSVYVPGADGPSYRQTPSNGSMASSGSPTRTASLGNTAARPASEYARGQSVLDSNLQNRTANANVYSGQNFNGQNLVGQPRGGIYQGQTVYQVPAASTIPSLGVPQNWDRSIRSNNCNTCGPGYGAMPYGLVRSPLTYQTAGQIPLGQPQAVFAQGAQPIATLPGQPQRRAYTPLINLQSFPPNAYAGQGIIGSPKLYVDGQPVRNLLRYLWIP